MLNLNEEELIAAIVEKASDEIIRRDDDLSGLIAKEVKSRIDKIFSERAEAQIRAAIEQAITSGFEREYHRVNSWGEEQGEKTTIRKELEKVINGYWNANVDARTGKESSYNSVTRAEYLMTKICAEDFSESMKQHAVNITGHLKDGLRGQLANHMDSMLNELFKVKSLQDQGKVEKPY